MSSRDWNRIRKHCTRPRVRVAAAFLLLVLIGVHVYLLRYTLKQFEEMDGYLVDLFLSEGSVMKTKNEIQNFSPQDLEKEINRHIMDGYGDLGKYLETAMAMADDSSMGMEYGLQGLRNPPEAPKNVHLLPIRIAYTAEKLTFSRSLSFAKGLLEACPVPAYLSGYRSVGGGRYLAKTEILIEVWIRVPL
jgi:hypothetical protein